MQIDIKKIFSELTGIATNPGMKMLLINLGWCFGIQHPSFVVEFFKRWVVYIDGRLEKFKKGSYRHAELMNERGFTYQEFCILLNASIDQTNYDRNPIFQLMYIHDQVDREHHRIDDGDNEMSKIARYLSALQKWIDQNSIMLKKQLLETKIPIYVDLQSFKRSSHLLASSGSGKSTLLKTMFHEIQRVTLRKRNISIVVVDPHSEMSLDMLRLKSNLLDKTRLVYLDTNLRDTAKIACGYDVIGTDVTFSINPFDSEGLSPYKISALADELANTLFSSIPTDDTVQMVTVLQNIIEFLVERPNSDMNDLLSLVKKGGEVKYIKDTHLMRNGVRKEFIEGPFLNDGRLTPTKSSIYMRLLSILSNSQIQKFLSGSRSVDIQSLINSGHTIICNFKASDVGPDGAPLMTKIFFGLLISAVKNRVSIPHKDRINTYLIADEFSTYYSKSVEEIVDQTRKFGLGAIFSHQRSSQISNESIKNALAATKIKIAGPSDSDSMSFMAKEMRHINVYDIDMLDDYSYFYQDKMMKKAGTFKFQSAPFLADDNSPYYMNKTDLAELFRWIAFESGFYRKVRVEPELVNGVYTHQFEEV